VGDYGLTDPGLGSAGFDYIERLVERIPLPFLSVRTHIERNRVLELSKGVGDALVHKVAHLMRQMHPLAAFINAKECHSGRAS